MLKKLIYSFCGKKTFQRFWNRVYHVSLTGLNVGGGGDYNSSGEKWALEYINDTVLKHKENAVIFDVGANVGGYTTMLLSVFNNPVIHCFEPADETFKCLNNAHGEKENVLLNKFGLSDVNSRGRLYYDEEKSGMASIHKRELGWLGMDFEKSEEIQLETLDHYCSNKNIEAIDFLKMDVEGNELNVLKGAEETLRKGSIRVMQLEFGGANVDSRTYFKDFWNLLSPEYHVFRLLRDGLYSIERYDETLEVFVCTNYLFIKKDNL